VTLDDILDQLNKRKQRATYGAVAGILGVSPQGVMGGRQPSHRDSWVVAAKTDSKRMSRRGWPTGYKDEEIHPECLRKIHHNPGDFIKDAAKLKQLLNS